MKRAGQDNNNIEPFTGYIYSIKFLDSILYVGSTINFRKRRTNHIWNCSNIKSKKYGLPIYKYLRANNIQLEKDMFEVEIIVINCKTKNDLRCYEIQLYLENKETVLNELSPLRTEEEKKENDKAYNQSEKRKENNKKYKQSEKGKETTKIQQQKYEQTEKRKAYVKAYYQKNKEKKNQKQRENRAKKKAEKEKNSS